ncbi:MAG: HIT domain-containing protein [Bacilli bacterium]
MDCLFCKIINKKISCYTIYEDDIALAFLDINPDCNGHILIIPKKHFLDIDDIDNKTFNHIFEISKDIKLLLEEKLNIEGLTFVQNNGDIQAIKHFHLHLKPFYKNNVIKPVKEIYDILKR